MVVLVCQPGSTVVAAKHSGCLIEQDASPNLLQQTLNLASLVLSQAQVHFEHGLPC